MEENIKKALDFYYLATSLKYKIRTGWIYWNLQSDRFESIAEHIYGTCILAISLDSEFNFNIDLNKTVKMLVIHELEECIIGDQTPFDMPIEEKEKQGHLAINQILKDLIKGQELEELILEFDKKDTKEAKFAYLCDKLEADLQSKYYDDNGYLDLNNQPNNPALSSSKVQDIIKDGNSKVSDIWIEFDKDKFSDDEIFSKIIKYIKQK